jgi:hypothetical protein
VRARCDSAAPAPQTQAVGSALHQAPSRQSFRRELVIRSTSSDGRYVYDGKWLNRPYGIEPGSTDEKLFGIVCK